MTIARGPGRPTAYKTADGKRVPGVTTITSRFKDSGGLIHWAWQQGVDGKDYRESRDKAADVGHIVHACIESLIHGEPGPTMPEDAEKAALVTQGVKSYETWAAQTRLELLETEVPIVSEEHRFGGTFDALGRLDGELVLVDWKTSNAVYGEYIVQMAAYRQLLKERDNAVIAGAHLLRFGKEHGDFHAHYYPASVLAMGWEWFKCARAMYDLDAKLKKLAA